MPRLLSPTDMEKLPPCKREPFGKCSREDYDKLDPKECARCLIEGVWKALHDENIAEATHLLNALYRMLEEDYFPKEDAK